MPETTSAGATPVATVATTVQTPEAPAAAATPESSTDSDEALGPAGMKALKVEREERAKAEKANRELTERLAKIEEANKSEHEKAVDAARKEGVAEERIRSDAKVRAAEVRAALTAAGVPSGMLALAAKDDTFATLKVNDEGDVPGLEDAVKQFRAAYPALFVTTPAAPTGRPDFGGGSRGTPASGGADINTMIRRAAGRA